ncbi:hypothetical protein RB195_002265 [Necator americanus]|uniref:Reverse transcriptase domain-containing protein n=1 Tax=Necator americanus TaxID=51031 RepID=A0ABR1DJP0_NECAM
MPLCLTFIDLKKVFDTVESEAVMEALDNQGVPTPYIKILGELYSNLTTKISPFYNDVIIDVKRGVRQGDTMRVKVDGRHLHHLRFADHRSYNSKHQMERMLAEFDETRKKIRLRLNLDKDDVYEERMGF